MLRLISVFRLISVVVVMVLIPLISLADSKPNFLVIVADDMGWSDTQPFGGEINTPNLVALADNGLRMTDFYVAPTCSPTRSMLMTGVDHHAVGLGTMKGLQTPKQKQLPHYQGQLMNNNVTVAELLQSHGYQTLMAGKWHLAKDESQYPSRRGFDHTFTLLEGGASHFGDALPLHQGARAQYLENGEPVELDEDFYSSIHYTDKIIDYLKQGDGQQPFFAYVAYTAPHDPLQVPDEWLERYRGQYDQGPAALRQQRLARLAQMGMVKENSDLWQAPQFPPWLPLYQSAWSERSAEERTRASRPMEIYAAMIELMDTQIGRIIEHLDKTGQLDNTYIVFLSDNGSSAATPLLYPQMTREWYLSQRNHTLENAGKPGSHMHLGQEWAVASNTPWRLYKATVAEGGIRSPFIVSGPGVSKGAIRREPAHVIDITSTLYELAGIDAANHSMFEGKRKLQGISLKTLWQGESDSSVDRALGFELFGNKAVRKGPWKAAFIQAPLGAGQWQLYNLEQDPSEMQDLSQQQSQILAQLIEDYQDYAIDNLVAEPEINLVPDASKLYTKECDWLCETKFFVVRQALKFM